jgi:hypothetical protein
MKNRHNAVTESFPFPNYLPPFLNPWYQAWGDTDSLHDLVGIPKAPYDQALSYTLALRLAYVRNHNDINSTRFKFLFIQNRFILWEL